MDVGYFLIFCWYFLIYIYNQKISENYIVKYYIILIYIYIYFRSLSSCWSLSEAAIYNGWSVWWPRNGQKFSPTQTCRRYYVPFNGPQGGLPYHTWWSSLPQWTNISISATKCMQYQKSTVCHPKHVKRNYNIGRSCTECRIWGL